LNGRKGNHEDVLDPFRIENGWFVIDFPSLLVKPARGLDETLIRRIRTTIIRLGLNDEDTCLKSREKYVKDYCKQKISFDFLREEAPFIAFELERQNLVTTINKIMGYKQDT
jgi:hypothetical protein